MTLSRRKLLAYIGSVGVLAALPGVASSKSRVFYSDKKLKIARFKVGDLVSKNGRAVGNISQQWGMLSSRGEFIYSVKTLGPQRVAYIESELELLERDGVYYLPDSLMKGRKIPSGFIQAEFPVNTYKV